MSDTTLNPVIVPSPTWRVAGVGMSWILSGLSFAATLYLCVAWPGLAD